MAYEMPVSARLGIQGPPSRVSALSVGFQGPQRIDSDAAVKRANVALGDGHTRPRRGNVRPLRRRKTQHRSDDQKADGSFHGCAENLVGVEPPESRCRTFQKLVALFEYGKLDKTRPLREDQEIRFQARDDCRDIAVEVGLDLGEGNLKRELHRARCHMAGVPPGKAAHVLGEPNGLTRREHPPRLVPLQAELPPLRSCTPFHPWEQTYPRLSAASKWP